MSRKLIPWDENKADVLRIAAEEVASGGMYGYLQRSVERIHEELGMEEVSTNNLSAYLRRTVEWAEIREQATSSDGGTVEITVEATPEPLPEDHPVVRDMEREIQALKVEVRSERKKRKEADEKAHVSEAVQGAIKDAVVPWEPEPYVSRQVSETRWGADMVLLLSDEHADHKIRRDQTMGIERYGFDVFRARAQRLAEVVEGFGKSYLPAYEFERLWVLKLGDAIQGDIHGMKLRNDLGNTVRAAMATGDVEADLIRRLAQVFPQVNVISVPGNHPRTTSHKEDEDPHDNFDYAISCGIAQRLQRLREEGRVTVHAPRSWGAFVNIRGWRCMMSHGDEVRSYRGFPWYGFDRREGRVKAMVERAHAVDPENAPESLDYLFYGHFHTPTKRSHAGSRSIHNGAFYETDAWTTKQLSVSTIPEQTALIFLDREPDHGHAFEVPIYLRDRERELALERGEWNPELGRTTVLDELDAA